MHLFRTREYVTAKAFWGALTAKLTRGLALADYEKVGEFLKAAMRFGYFYLYDRDKNIVFTPKYTDDGLKFGNSEEKGISQNEFEKRYISSLASTSIEAYSFTAEEGMLHEVEFISPYTMDEGEPIFLRGLLWVSEISDNELSVVGFEENDFSIVYGKRQVKFSELIDTLQVGGERRYGFGLLKREGKPKKEEDSDLSKLGFWGRWEGRENEIYLEIEKDIPIWSHVKYTSDLKIKGSIEPVVGRDWSNKGAGRELSTYGLCWSPGSILIEEETFKVMQDFGIWVKE
jgi:hypothetical protein